MRTFIFLAAAFVLVPKLWNVSDIDRDVVRQVVQAWTTEHHDEIQAVVREVILSRSRVGALSSANEAADVARADGAREPRRSYWQ